MKTSPLLVRVGVEGGRKAVLARAAELRAPILISANSLWNNRRKNFTGWKTYQHHDVALDSGGFVAMLRYGGYRWSVEQYVTLARDLNPTWWAQMDFCCEPEIAADQATIFKRIDLTAEHLHACRQAAGAAQIPPPMPVLQGWRPSDYIQGPLYSGAGAWPDLVGVGSVCRRSVNGPDGVINVVQTLDRVLPGHVKLHLFGVKSTALVKLAQCFPHRIHSTDSMAWNRAGSIAAYHAGQSFDSERRADAMQTWYQRQQNNLSQSPDQFQLL